MELRRLVEPLLALSGSTVVEQERPSPVDVLNAVSQPAAPALSKYEDLPVLVKRGSESRYVFEHYMDLLNNVASVPLTLASHRGLALVWGREASWRSRLMPWVSGWGEPPQGKMDLLKIGDSKDAILVHYDGAFLARADNHIRVFSTFGWRFDEWARVLIHTKGSEGSVLGCDSVPGQRFTVNLDGTVSPTAAPHLVLGRDVSAPRLKQALDKLIRQMEHLFIPEIVLQPVFFIFGYFAWHKVALCVQLALVVAATYLNYIMLTSLAQAFSLGSDVSESLAKALVEPQTLFSCTVSACGFSMPKWFWVYIRTLPTYLESITYAQIVGEIVGGIRGDGLHPEEANMFAKSWDSLLFVGPAIGYLGLPMCFFFVLVSTSTIRVMSMYYARQTAYLLKDLWPGQEDDSFLASLIRNYGWNYIGQLADIASLGLMSAFFEEIKEVTAQNGRSRWEQMHPGEALYFCNKDDKRVFFFAKIAFGSCPMLWLNTSRLAIAYTRLSSKGTLSFQVQGILMNLLTIAMALPGHYRYTRDLKRAFGLRQLLVPFGWARGGQALYLVFATSIFGLCLARFVGVWACPTHIFNTTSGCVVP